MEVMTNSTKKIAKINIYFGHQKSSVCKICFVVKNSLFQWLAYVKERLCWRSNVLYTSKQECLAQLSQQPVDRWLKIAVHNKLVYPAKSFSGLSRGGRLRVLLYFEIIALLVQAFLLRYLNTPVLFLLHSYLFEQFFYSFK